MNLSRNYLQELAVEIRGLYDLYSGPELEEREWDAVRQKGLEMDLDLESD